MTHTNGWNNEHSRDNQPKYFAKGRECECVRPLHVFENTLLQPFRACMHASNVHRYAGNLVELKLRWQIRVILFDEWSFAKLKALSRLIVFNNVEFLFFFFSFRFQNSPKFSVTLFLNDFVACWTFTLDILLFIQMQMWFFLNLSTCQ